MDSPKPSRSLLFLLSVVFIVTCCAVLLHRVLSCLHLPRACGLLSPRDFAVFIATCFVVFFRRVTSRSSLPRASWSSLPRDFAVGLHCRVLHGLHCHVLRGLHCRVTSRSSLPRASWSSSPLHPPGKTRQSRSGLSLGQRRAHSSKTAYGLHCGVAHALLGPRPPMKSYATTRINPWHCLSGSYFPQ